MAKPPSGEDRAFGPNGVEDMITLDNLTEETMLRNIQIRYNKNLIYVRHDPELIGLTTPDLHRLDPRVDESVPTSSHLLPRCGEEVYWPAIGPAAAAHFCDR